MLVDSCQRSPHSTKRDAQALRARLLTQVNEGKRPATDATVAQLLGRWLVAARSLIVRGGQLVEKDTKTHAARRIALSDDGMSLLDDHRRRCEGRARLYGTTLTLGAYVFSFDRPAGSR